MGTDNREAAELLAVAESLSRQTRRRLHTTSLIAGLAGVSLLLTAALSGLGLTPLVQAVVSSALSMVVGVVAVRVWSRARERFDTGPPREFGYGVLAGLVAASCLLVFVFEGRPPSFTQTAITAAVFVGFGVLTLFRDASDRFFARIYIASGVVLASEAWLWPDSFTPRRIASGVLLLGVAGVVWWRTNHMTVAG